MGVQRLGISAIFQKMKNVAVAGRQVRSLLGKEALLQTVSLDKVSIAVGLIETPKPSFDSLPGDVLVRKKAFSLNFRDRRMLYTVTLQARENGFYVIGSDFFGEVVAVAPDISSLKPGDRIIGNHSYPATDGVQPGLATPHASREYEVLKAGKLLRVPDTMPDAEAAAFAVGAQTVYSMIRRLDLQPGANVLVTAAKSNTSLFAINALQQRKVNVYATSTSLQYKERFERMGVKEVVSFADYDQLTKLARSIGGFTHVIDPFWDIHFARVLPVMRMEGKYISCGVYDQYLDLTGGSETQRRRFDEGCMLHVLVKNLQILGNCIGTTEDLQAALDDYACGRLKVVIDSVFHGTSVGAFVERTYAAKDRFGKVVFSYE